MKRIRRKRRERDSGWSERDLSRHSFYRNSATLFFASSSCSFVVAARSEGIQQPWNFRFKKALSRKSGEKNYLDNSAHYLCVSHTQYVDEISKIVFKKIVKTSTALIKFWVDFFFLSFSNKSNVYDMHTLIKSLAAQCKFFFPFNKPIREKNIIWL